MASLKLSQEETVKTTFYLTPSGKKGGHAFATFTLHGGKYLEVELYEKMTRDVALSIAVEIQKAAEKLEPEPKDRSDEDL